MGDFKNSELILTKSLELVSSHRVWIAQLFIKAGLYDRSLQILDKLDLNFISLLDTKIFLELAKRLREDGQQEKFFDVLQKAIEFVQLLKESEQPQGFGQIIQTYLSLGFGL